MRYEYRVMKDGQFFLLERRLAWPLPWHRVGYEFKSADQAVEMAHKIAESGPVVHLRLGHLPQVVG